MNHTGTNDICHTVHCITLSCTLSLIAWSVDSTTYSPCHVRTVGEKGTAYTLISPKDTGFAGDLVRNLVRMCGIHVRGYIAVGCACASVCMHA